MKEIVMAIFAVGALAAHAAFYDGRRGEWKPRPFSEMVKERNFDESKVPGYSLPDPLVDASGKRVSADEWRRSRRAEVLKLIAENEYGFPLPPPAKVEAKVISEKKDALAGLATRRETMFTFYGPNGKSLSATMLLYIPNAAKGPVPVFLCLNFNGNQATTVEEDVTPLEWRVKPVKNMRKLWKWSQLEQGAKRGLSARRWPYREILSRGYAVGTACYHEFYPDMMDAGGYSALALFMDEQDVDGPQYKYTPISAWAWGLSRMLDYCETEPRIDAAKAAVAGHSRLGKTALWAGAVDERFKLVCPNNSGCGGVALHRREFGEVIEDHLTHRDNRADAFWFTEPFAEAWGREASLPYDQHEVVALVAPRTIAVGVATKDVRADPKGEYLSVVAAAPVWRLLGLETPLPAEMPRPGGAIVGPVSFHVREGGHDMLLEDWNAYMDVADWMWRGGK